jgi:glycosyltransferase involved in cell wall biosynthesis
MIPTYNCAHYLRQTLASVLAHGFSPEEMQIEVVDDCSTRDDPAAVVAEVGRGRVGFYRQPRNVGHIQNFNTCLARSRGHLVHVLHGDDMVREGFYSALQAAFEAHPAIGAAFCRDIRIDEEGRWIEVAPLVQGQSGVIDNWLEQIVLGQRLQVCAMVVRRDVYERLGGFDQRIKYYGEDWEMWVRIAAHYAVYHEVMPLALYRVHKTSLTGRSFRTGENAQDIRQVISINRTRLPEAHAAELTRRAHDKFARSSIRRAHKMIIAGDLKTPFVQLREALKSSRSPGVISASLLLLARWNLAALRTIARTRHALRASRSR